MGRSQRAKGAGAELEVAALLQEWWRQLEPEAIFKRCPASGGWASPEARAGFRASGDLVTTALRFPFVVEVKRREIGTDKNLAAGFRHPVWGWWVQAQRQAREQGEGAVPLLVFRRSREQWRVLVPEDWWRGQDFALWMASREWRKRWPIARGLRPVCHYLVQMTTIHPRWMALEE